MKRFKSALATTLCIFHVVQYIKPSESGKSTITYQGYCFCGSSHSKFILKFSKYQILPIVEDRCDLKTGYADGGSDKQVGVAYSPQQCLELVRNSERKANAITWDSRNQK